MALSAPEQDVATAHSAPGQSVPAQEPSRPGTWTKEELEARRRGRSWAAVSSVLFALLLTSTKLVVGLWTGSLGIISEALHSGMDMVGTGVSWGAIRISNRPPDSNHPYGHAKFESLSALVCVVILSITAIGILNEAYRRIFFNEHAPEVNVWGFAVIILSVSVDYTRSRYLRRAAERYGSQALAADAAHFSTDLYSSISVLAGLTIVAIGATLGWPERVLITVDALAGSVVAVIIVTVAFRLAVRAINSLTDYVPPTLINSIVEAADRTPHTLGESTARVRMVGDQAYADVTIGVPRGLSSERISQVSNEVVRSVQRVLPHADVTVHTLPMAPESESAVEKAIVAAARQGVGVHHVRAFETPAGLRIDLHMEVPESMMLDEAHMQADDLEAELRREIPELREVQVHIEPRHGEVHLLAGSADAALVRRIYEAAAAEAGAGLHDVDVLSSEHGLVVTVHCYMPGDMPLVQAHTQTAEIEKAIRSRVPGVYRVTVHPEPTGA